MQVKPLQTEMVIDINTQRDLAQISNIKLDLLLSELQRQERYAEIKPAPEKVKLRVKTVEVSKLGNRAPQRAEARIVNKQKINTDSSPQGRIEIKPQTRSMGMPASNPVPNKPAVAIKINSIIAKARARKV